MIRPIRLWPSIIVVSVPIASLAHAEPADAPTSVVNVTSTRLVQDDPATSVRVFTRADIERSGAASLGDFLARAAGVAVDRRGRAGGYGAVFLRGADPSHLVVLVDGVRQNDPLSSRGNAVDVNALGLDDVERVEIAAGNASVAHGEALAGVIHVITAAHAGRRRAAHVSAGGEETWAAGAAFGNDALRVAAGASSTGERDDPGLRNRAVNLGWRGLAASGSLEVAMRHAVSDARAIPDDAGGIRFAALGSLETTHSRTTQASASWRRYWGGGASVHAQVIRFERDGDGQTPAVPGGLRDPFGLPGIATDQHYVRTEARFELSAPALGWEALVGVHLQSERGELDSVLFLGKPFDAGFAQRRQVRSLYVEARRSVGPLTIHPGIRVESDPDSVRAHPALRVQCALAGGADIGAALSSATKRVSFYALGHPLIGNSALRPEGTRQAEAYYARPLPAGALRVTVFRLHFTDLVDFDSTPPPRLVNRTGIRSTGVELQLRHALGPRADARIGASWMQVNHGDGEPLRHRPRLQANASLNWLLRPALWLDSQLAYAGRRYDSSIPTGARWLTPLTELSVALRYRRGDAETFVQVDNLTNTDREEVIGTPVGARRLRVGMRFTL